MKQGLAAQGRVLAVLGPTNTGKTHFAVERMLAHASGLIGFPLRLLAREVYDRVVAIKGARAVALRTGEERLGSDDAAYVIATVEAMPLGREVAFLAIDEVQLCADFERGHVFTERLLHARGLHETMFLGAETIRPVLKRLVPQAEVITRPRFSTLTFSGHAKLHRLPRRSAIVAFSAADVYALAEVIRRRRGGAAVVLGALSPRTRNAQVALYQAGEVDHLVATDAIGMGLNLDLAHVAFAAAAKFDGRHMRPLAASELAQIAGRAGRHLTHGTFGTTDGCAPLDEKLVQAVEEHSFAPIKALRWRNAELDFRSLDGLLASLEQRAPADCLQRVRDALDDRSLALLARRPEVRGRAHGEARVRLLWQVCQIPDFTKTLRDAHLHLLATVYGHITSGRGMLPNDYVGRMITRIDQVDGDIDALVARLSHIRTWTYLSNRADWLADAPHWQGIARAVEDRLSDALHERLTQRFVDRRTAGLIRSMRDRGELGATVEADGEVCLDGHLVGRLQGLEFTADRSDAELGRKVLAAAARQAVTPELERRARSLAAAPDTALALLGDQVTWLGAPVAKLTAGHTARRPKLRLIAADVLSIAGAAMVEKRLQRWLELWLAQSLGGLDRLAEAAGGSELNGAARGLAFSLVQGLGSVAWAEAGPLAQRLEGADRRRLTRLGVRFGRLHLYVADTLLPPALEARRQLLELGGAVLGRPLSGATAWRPPAELEPDHIVRLGYAPLGPWALRQDVAERVAALLRKAVRDQGWFTLPQRAAVIGGLSAAELAEAMPALGYRSAERDGAVLWTALRRPRREGPATIPAPRADSPFAALAALAISKESA